MSQMEAVLLFVAVISRDESGEKSTPFILRLSSFSLWGLTFVFAFHITTAPNIVPAAIHLPSLGTERHRTSSPPTTPLAICLPSSTRHPRTPKLSSLVQRCLPLAENVTADRPRPALISISGFNNRHQCALHLVSTHRALLTTWSSNNTM